TISGWYQIDGVKVPHQPLNPYTQNNKDQDEAALGFHTSTTSLSSFVLLIRFEASAVGGRICVAGTSWCDFGIGGGADLATGNSPFSLLASTQSVKPSFQTRSEGLISPVAASFFRRAADTGPTFSLLFR